MAFCSFLFGKGVFALIKGASIGNETHDRSRPSEILIAGYNRSDHSIHLKRLVLVTGEEILSVQELPECNGMKDGELADIAGLVKNMGGDSVNKGCCPSFDH